MALMKIHYLNEEEEGTVELEVNCPPSEYIAVEGLIDEFKMKNRFDTSANSFIKHLKKFGFETKKIEYDIEVY